MSAARLLRTARTAAERVGAWALRRARERSTWAGLGLLATALGHEALGAQLGHVGDAAALLLGVGMATASTSQHPPAQP